MARIIPIEPDEGAAIDAATATLSKACPVAIPTETVYGLAADATDAAAITRIYETKGRPRFNPLICHMADLAMASALRPSIRCHAGWPSASGPVR